MVDCTSRERQSTQLPVATFIFTTTRRNLTLWKCEFRAVIQVSKLYNFFAHRWFCLYFENVAIIIFFACFFSISDKVKWYFFSANIQYKTQIYFYVSFVFSGMMWGKWENVEFRYSILYIFTFTVFWVTESKVDICFAQNWKIIETNT